jgi:uncharacterized C2H2 Zn-finger protein
VAGLTLDVLLSLRGRCRYVDAIGTQATAGRPRRRLARQNLKCPKCDRRFASVMDLARYANTMHGAKKGAGKKKAA